MSHPPKPAQPSVSAPNLAKTSMPPPQSPQGSAGLSHSAVKAKATLAAPPAQVLHQHSTTPEMSPLLSRSTPQTASIPVLLPTPPLVPASSWYAQPFAERSAAPMSAFHRDHRGKTIFSLRPVPVEAAELQALPEQRPPTVTVFEVGKDLLYGMAYLYAAPLAVEHQWRGRVAHLLRVRKQEAPIPDVVRRGVQGRTTLQRQLQAQESGASLTPPSSPLSMSPLPSPAPAAAAVTPAAYISTMRFERGETAVFDRPADDLLIGIKVFVNEELVEDHYPDVHALPQCTATVTAREAAQFWNCVPFVLMGYLNQTLLDPISLFHTLSLNFVEHLLRVKLPGRHSTGSAEGRTEAPLARPPSSVTAPSRLTKAAPVELPLRVEVVYGCRAEAFYCTGFISRGCCVLRMTEASKPSLKSYEEKLRALVKARHKAPQLIPRPKIGLPSPRACVGCGHPLQYRCTVCGAEVCGTLACSSSAVVGYPRACTRHALQC
ncbi:hypothetical protein GH5_04049 [Leishmania sp. Ghana 2012 LV757]|uniref:hypothetical protein n=1 Tax=Leishmania sp. Ghana 2012 LV757 TaxID=2803181 RepID=UPI001B429F42|nr:hypothetical protein GH5_04049 [Leishmania sp. Ghana 2012 LV757]